MLLFFLAFILYSSIIHCNGYDARDSTSILCMYSHTLISKLNIVQCMRLYLLTIYAEFTLFTLFSWLKLCWSLIIVSLLYNFSILVVSTFYVFCFLVFFHFFFCCCCWFHTFHISKYYTVLNDKITRSKTNNEMYIIHIKCLCQIWSYQTYVKILWFLNTICNKYVYYGREKNEKKKIFSSFVI